MNKIKSLYLKLGIYLLVCSKLFSQFIEVNAELDLRRLSEGDRIIFENLSTDIKNYFINTQFGNDIDDLNIEISCRIILESVSRGGNQTTINAQAIFVNKQKQNDGNIKSMDQYFYAKSIQFPYEKGRKIFYTTSFEPLASFLNYYAFMFIGSELDTYEYMGGTIFFNKAIELANMGKDSDWSNGWDNRWKKARKSKKNEFLRSMRYNFFLALDEYKYSEEIKINNIITAMNSFYEDFVLLDKKIGSDKETLHFLKAYNKEIAEILYFIKMNEALHLLTLYDHDHKEVYKSYLNK